MSGIPIRFRDAQSAVNWLAWIELRLRCAPSQSSSSASSPDPANTHHSPLTQEFQVSKCPTSSSSSTVHICCVSSVEGRRVVVALPPLSRLFADCTRYWAGVAQTEVARQYLGRCRMAMLQTIGGGWASLRCAKEAMRYAVEMYYTAISVFDGEMAMKCRLFIGWSVLWSGYRQAAIAIFKRELTMAELYDQIEQKRRCEHAIIHATSNHTLRCCSRSAIPQQELMAVLQQTICSA